MKKRKDNMIKMISLVLYLDDMCVVQYLITPGRTWGDWFRWHQWGRGTLCCYVNVLKYQIIYCTDINVRLY